MPKDTKSLGNNKAPACESRGFVRKKQKVCILTHLLFLFYALTGSNEKTSCEASVHMHITCSVYKSFDTDEACRTRTAFNLKSELETSNNSFKTVIDR